MSHLWSTKNDWDYCTCTNCKIVNNNIILDDSLTGSILSDIRDSSPRIYDYAEIIPTINIPSGSSALFYVRSGWNSEYYEDSWTDWKLVNEPERITETTLSLTTTKIIADYNIKSLTNVYLINDYKHAAFVSGIVDEGIVDMAQVDHSGTELTIYATDAAIVNNVIILKNPLPADNMVVVIQYIPRYFVYSNMKNRYFQFKIDLTVEPLYWRTSENEDYAASDGELINLGQTGPSIQSIVVDYILDFQHEIERAFPKFYRRL